jgi:hypothetical protein
VRSRSLPEETVISLAELVKQKIPVSSILDVSEIARKEIDTVIIGLGFEERAEVSVQRLLSAIKPKEAMLVRYTHEGRADRIKAIVQAAVENVREVNYTDVGSESFDGADRNTLIDVTGLAKPVLFHAVRNHLRHNCKVWICHTKAELHYPRDEDIQRVLQAQEKHDYYRLLEEMQRILTGEQAPYKERPLLLSDADESRQRMLCAFSSPKHERLLKLLEREYDRVTIVVQDNDTPRTKLSVIAAEVAARNFTTPNADIHPIESDNLVGVLTFIIELYQRWYVEQGFNFEIGLTGSKLQAVACAAASAVLKISQCWYVAPARYDPARFTEGFGDTSYFEIALASQD